MRSQVRPRKEKNDSIVHTLSEIEIINFFQTEINDPEQSCLDIYMVDCIFKEILLENGEFVLVCSFTTALAVKS